MSRKQGVWIKRHSNLEASTGLEPGNASNGTLLHTELDYHLMHTLSYAGFRGCLEH